MRKSLRNLLTQLAICSALVTPHFALASSHREAPGTTKSPKLDNTDVYAFNSYEPGRDGYTTLIANYQPFQFPGGGPNYYTMDPDAVYEIQVDNIGDATEHLTFQFKFSNTLTNGTGETLSIGNPPVTVPIALRQIGDISKPNDTNLGETESFTLNMISGNRRTGTIQPVVNTATNSTTFLKPVDNIGEKTIADYPTYAKQFIYNVTFPGCPSGANQGRVFVGQREEAFAVAVDEIFDQVNFVPIDVSFLPNAGLTQDPKRNSLIGKYNVTSLAVEVPSKCLAGSGNGVIGVWASASTPQASLQDPSAAYEKQALTGGAYVQRSRLGFPLINELIIGLKDKDKFNGSNPVDDAQFATYVTNPTYPQILSNLFLNAVNQAAGLSLTSLAPTNFPRADVVATTLTGFQGLNQLSKVTDSEMLRLNTTIPPTPIASQNPYGVVASDLAGFPNGRRPGDNVTDIILRVAMGRLCYPVPLNGPNNPGTDLGLCKPTDAQSGLVPYTDGAPTNATLFQNAFPYLNDPIPGSPQTAEFSVPQ